MTELIDLLQKVLSSLAIIIGSVWAYYKFIKGRLFYPRLEVIINGHLISNESNNYLILYCGLKNVGSSKVDLNIDSSAVRVFKCESTVIEDPLEIESADWIHLGSFPIFTEHKWIEGGEVIKDTLLLSVQYQNGFFYKSVIKIVGQKISWNAAEIIYKTEHK